VDKTSVFIMSPYLEMLNDTGIIDKVIAAERQGYDAAIIGCYADPGLQQARSVVDMPVTGACESGMLLAQLLGNKFAAVTAGPGWIPVIEANIRRYGFGERTVKNLPVRQFDLGQEMPAVIDAYRGKPERLISLFEREALKCIEDGADVVIAGCCYVGPLFSLIGYREVANTGVPVIDPAAAALKLAETLADLRSTTGVGKSQCPTSLYATPPRELLDQVRKDFGF
jgi:allantoin racemase